jgi:regulator of protease activity HflC (stomatin/prohibitin superfamily)
VLEPTIGNYFRNAAQGSDIIDFLKNRSTRQNEARAAISEALREYNVGAVDTLIGDIVPPDQLMKTLTDRKLAEQERVTFETQRQAQTVRQELEQATALAATQARRKRSTPRPMPMCCAPSEMQRRRKPRPWARRMRR